MKTLAGLLGRDPAGPGAGDHHHLHRHVQEAPRQDTRLCPQPQLYCYRANMGKGSRKRKKSLH